MFKDEAHATRLSNTVCDRDFWHQAAFCVDQKKTKTIQLRGYLASIRKETYKIL